MSGPSDLKQLGKELAQAFHAFNSAMTIMGEAYREEMARLEQPAKSEVSTADLDQRDRFPIPDACDHAAIRAHAYRCGFADAKAGKVTPPLGGMTFPEHEAAKAEGAREERERIIARFVENTKSDTFEDGEVFLTRWSALNGTETVHNEAGIRAALEPKP